jgi:hypothetical protein
MNSTIILAMAFALIAGASLRSPHRRKLKWLQHLSGSRKFFGIVAFLIVLLMLLNPEFLALGLLGDTAFIDMLVLAIGLQLHTYFFSGCRSFATALRKGISWAGIPSPGLCYSIAVATVLIESAISILQKYMHRIFS